MSSNVQRLRPSDPPASAERAELALAIAAAEEDRSAVRAAGDAITSAREIVAAAEVALEVAKAAVTEAKGTQASRVLSAAKAGTAVASDPSLREARAREGDAADDLDAARSVLEMLENDVAGPVYKLERSENRVTQAVDAVLKSAPIARMLEEAEDLQRKLVERRTVLRHLFFDHLVADEHKPAVKSFLHSRELPGGYGDVQFGEVDETPSQPWRQAREALNLDPDAPLPVH